jgi:porin
VSGPTRYRLYVGQTRFSLHLLRVRVESHQSLLVNWNDHAWATGFVISGSPPASAATGLTAQPPLPGRLQVCYVWKVLSAPLFLVVGVVSAIPLVCTGNEAPWWAMNDLTAGNLQATTGTLSRVTAPDNAATASDNLTAASFHPSLAGMDKVLGLKGWNYNFPSFGETVTLDYGGWRSNLASVGIGLIQFNVTRFQANMLDTPREGPRFNPFYESKQNYWGQNPSFANISGLVLTYDLSRFGVPDGQLQLAGNVNYATYEGYNPNTLAFHFLAYYQTLFDRRLEIKFGLVGNQNEFVGQTIGGNFATTGGPANSIISLLGMSGTPVSTWSFRITGHLSEKFYNEMAVMRSLVVNGPTGNVLFDTDELNPTRLDWNVNTSSFSPIAEVGAPGTRELFVDEFGYKQDATPSSLYTWARLGVMYNNSTFHDFTKSVAEGGLTPGAIGPTKDGNTGFYLLADQQIWQMAPDSAKTASRGLYAGGTIMYARADRTPITQYYEGRLYIKAPFESRPKDLVSLVAYYQVNSPYLVDNLNTLNAVGTYGKPETWSATVGYLARLRPGVSLSLGFNYTANPAQAFYFGPSKANPSQRFEGNALNFQAALFTTF